MGLAGSDRRLRPRRSPRRDSALISASSGQKRQSAGVFGAGQKSGALGVSVFDDELDALAAPRAAAFRAASSTVRVWCGTPVAVDFEDRFPRASRYDPDWVRASASVGA